MQCGDHHSLTTHTGSAAANAGSAGPSAGLRPQDEAAATVTPDSGGPPYGQRDATCPHQPPCPPADRPDRAAAHIIASHPEQGWSLLCNGVVLFDDTGQLLPDCCSVPPQPPTHKRLPSAA